MKTTLNHCAIGCITLIGSAFPAPLSAADVGIGLNLGTLGPGLDVGYGLSDNLVVRAGFNRFEISEDFTEDDIDYSADLNLENFHLLTDWHILAGGFRVTAGVILNDNRFDGSASVEAGDEVEGETVPRDGRLDLSVSYDDVAPYVGIGWGNLARGRSSFAFTFDLGVMVQGSANVDIDDNGTTGLSSSTFEAEEESVQNELDDFDVFPVVAASFIYRF